MAVLGVLRRCPEVVPDENFAPRHAAHVDADRHMDQEALDLGAEDEADAFVGVELEHPVAVRMIERDVALGGEAEPWLLDHERPGGSRDLAGTVGRARVHDHQLLSECHAGEAVRQRVLLVVDDHADRQSRALRGVLLRMCHWRHDA